MSRKRLFEIAEELLTLSDVPEKDKAELIESARKHGDKELCFLLFVASSAASNRMVGMRETLACLHGCMGVNVQAEMNAAELFLRSEEQADSKALS